MMKISRQQFYNLALLIFAVLILFTPVGTTVKVWVNRLIAFGPSEIPVEERDNIDSYKWDLPVYTPLTRAPEKMYSESIPATWILDKRGNMVVQKKGAADWESEKVENILDKLLRE